MKKNCNQVITSRADTLQPSRGHKDAVAAARSQTTRRNKKQHCEKPQAARLRRAPSCNSTIWNARSATCADCRTGSRTGSRRRATCASGTVTSCRHEGTSVAHRLAAWSWQGWKEERRKCDCIQFKLRCTVTVLVWSEPPSLPLGISAGVWGASVEETELANFIQQENTKQNVRYSIAVLVRVPGQTELLPPTQQWWGSALEGRKRSSRYNGSDEKYNKWKKEKNKTSNEYDVFWTCSCWSSSFCSSKG